MLLSNRPQTVYRKAPVHEVICQLRFPAILSINNTEPSDFQEAIRAQFPQYVRRQESAAPVISGLGGPSPRVEQKPPVTNYNFVTEDNLWKLNLTQNFIALSTLHYSGWREFARVLDRPLAEFIRLYKPAYFERVGLRYINLVSRQKLGLTGSRWADLIVPAYVGPMADTDFPEDSFLSCSTDLQLKTDSSCVAKIHAGPGQIKTGGPDTPQDPEVKFILDLDLSMGGKMPCTLAAGALETLHIHAVRLFEGAVTDSLRQAMDPQ